MTVNERSENMRIQCHIGNAGKGTQRGALLPTVQPHHCLSCVLCGVNSMCVVHLHQDGTRQNSLRLSPHLIPGVDEYLTWRSACAWCVCVCVCMLRVCCVYVCCVYVCCVYVWCVYGVCMVCVYGVCMGVCVCACVCVRVRGCVRECVSVRAWEWVCVQYGSKILRPYIGCLFRNMLHFTVTIIPTGNQSASIHLANFRH